MSVLIKGLNIKPCKDGFDGKGLVIIGYDDKLYAVAHDQIIPLPDHGDLIDRDALEHEFICLSNDEWNKKTGTSWARAFEEAADVVYNAPAVIPAERSEE